jgi:hypothetical protein
MLRSPNAQPLLKGRVKVANGDRGWGGVSAGLHTRTVINDSVDVNLDRNTLSNGDLTK